MLILVCLLWAYDGTNRLDNVGCISRAPEEGDQRGTGHFANQGVTVSHDLHSPVEFRKLLYYAHCVGGCMARRTLLSQSRWIAGSVVTGCLTVLSNPEIAVSSLPQATLIRVNSILCWGQYPCSPHQPQTQLSFSCRSHEEMSGYRREESSSILVLNNFLAAQIFQITCSFQNARGIAFRVGITIAPGCAI